MSARPPTEAPSNMQTGDDAVATMAVPEALFASILDIAADAIIVMSASQHILHFNQGASTIFGYLPEEMIGRPLTDLMPERFRHGHSGHVDGFGAKREPARRMGERREIYGLRRNGVEFPAEASISRLETRNGVVYSVVLRDITDRTLRARNERFLGDASGLLGTSLEMADTLQALANVPVPYLAEACVVDIVAPDGSWQREVSSSDDPALQAALEAISTDALSWDNPWRAIDVMRSRDAEIQPVVDDDWLEAHTDDDAMFAHLKALGIKSAIFVPLVARDHVLGCLSLFRLADARYDRTQLELAQQLAVRAAYALDNARLYSAAQRARKAREDVLSVVSHDLGNPLAAIRLCSSALLESPPSQDEERRQLVHAISNSADWMSRLIQDLLDMSTIEVGKLSIERRSEQLLPVVSQALAMVAPQAAERGVQLSAEVDDELPPVDGDAGRLVQVLANLLGNALKYTPRDGRVTVLAKLEGDEVVMRVADTGCGIPAAELPRLFERYYTRRRGANKSGSGLGLSIARGIVEAHGGRIWVESVEGKGTTFVVALPSST